MKKLIISTIGLASVLAFWGCGKENPPSPQYGSILFLNAAPLSATTPASSFYIDDSLSKGSNGIMNYIANTGYLGVLPGQHKLSFKQDAGIKNPAAADLATITQSIAANQAFSMVAYDTITGGKVKSFIVKDNLAQPSMDSARVRFWNLAMNYPSASVNSFDVTLLRTSIVPNDSVTIKNRIYPGATGATAADQEPFTSIPAGTYTAKIKLPNTQTLVTSVSLGAVGRRKMLTYYFAGNSPYKALSISSITNKN